MGRMPELEPERIARLEEDAVVLLDQRRLPAEEVEVRCGTAAEVADAIRSMVIRGAPAIGVAAAYGLALAAAAVRTSRRRTRCCRPPGRPRRTSSGRSTRCGTTRRRSGRGRSTRRRSSAAGAWRRTRSSSSRPGARVLTHCNAGGLATGGYGTAVGAIRRAWEEGLVAHVWVDETRPLLQGSRLTAWELEGLGVPFAVLADAAAASRMAAGEVDCVVTGADRIAANGDTANKVGTYALAVLARHHGIPLYVVAPTSTVDLATPTGAGIPIEERDPAEVTDRFPARNPAFDVTPAELIAAIVTETGVHRAPYEVTLSAR